MIVRQFLRWVQTAPAGDRAEATSALARAYLYSDLSDEDRLAAEAAMIVLLDDPSPLVRRALAEALQNADVAPHGVIISLVSDQRDIAELIAQRSPVLSDAELVDLVGGGAEWMQAAIAARDPLSRAVAGAIAEVGCAQACLVLIENPYVDVTASALARVADRHGHLSAIREALFARSDLPMETRQALVAKRDPDETAALVRHLMSSGQLTGMLLLRALLSGNMSFLIEAFAELSGLSDERVARILSDKSGSGFRALYQKAGLPDVAFTAFRAALQAVHETGFAGDAIGASMLKRRMIERVLTQYEGAAEGEVDFLFAMLRRLAAEAARDEARYYTADLIAAA